MKYCKTTTNSHPLALKHNDCLKGINEIVLKEGGKNGIFEHHQIALNLDDVEVKLKHPERKATMDMSFGVSVDTKNPKMVLVDFKFKHKSAKTLGKHDLEAKIDGSIALLSRDIDILNEYFFIFNDSLKHEARSHFNRLFAGRSNRYIPLKLTELKEKFFNIK
jgi:hypothetical protein